MATQALRLPIPRLDAADPAAFLEFWANFYSWDNEKYEKHIRCGERLTRRDIHALMTWKAGSRFAARADQVATKAGALAAELNMARTKESLSDDDLRDLFQVTKPAVPNGLVWRVFLCHIASPHQVPIYDVNVWLAWRYIEGTLSPGDLRLTPKRFASYLEYRRFFFQLVPRNQSHRLLHEADRRADVALMSFGQWIRTRVGSSLIGV